MIPVAMQCKFVLSVRMDLLTLGVSCRKATGPCGCWGSFYCRPVHSARLLDVLLQSKLYLSWGNVSDELFIWDLFKMLFWIVGFSFHFQNTWVWNELLWYFCKALGYWNLWIMASVQIHEFTASWKPNPRPGAEHFPGTLEAPASSSST